ncbi:MAG: nucleoside deaminase [Bacteroidales bacterium]|nr:nucleoside deaminase [Bacteroidales bacterium]MBQ6741948.1 nucleoside deaminase [Bacteroidales bacterium]
MSDDDYMQMAYAEAQAAYDEDEIPVGAVVVCDGRVIASAHNQTERLGDTTAHAEMLALTAAEDELGSKYLDECTLYVTLEPCIMCAGAIGWAQVKRLVYGANDEKRGYSRFSPSPLHPKTEVTTGLMKEECEQLIKRFFKEKR